MKALVIGGGGREHAIAWRLVLNTRISKVYVAPGNAGTALDDGLFNVPITSIPVLVEFAKREQIALTVVGPEAPLADGVVDAFRDAGLKIFGPTQRAARLESSKEFAKDFMQRHGIPTAEYQSFTDAESARSYVRRVGAPIVIKADGLAAGKGVVVAMNLDEALAAIDRLLPGDDRSAKIVVEQFLFGEEASFMVLSDGKNVLPLATSQDHKRLLDGDRGPNTGGMGAYSPAPMVTPQLHFKIMREIIQPAIAGMEEDGNPYVGFLYAGVMIKGNDVKVLEFNCRMGDPETQPILMRLKSDLLGLIERGLAGTLANVEADWDRRTALAVVLAAHGYPDSPRVGDAIEGVPKAGDDFRVFHSGTALKEKQLVTNGGRVLCVTALGDSVRMAQRRAYQIADQIRYDGCQMRRDIGHRATGANKVLKVTP